MKCRLYPDSIHVIPHSGDWPQCQRADKTRTLTHTAHTHTYNSFMSIFDMHVDPRGEQLNTGPETGSIPPSV